jgi:CheY-like chemotaxis protein
MSKAKVVLCIDDDELGMNVRRTLLNSAGYKVLTAATGKDGLRIMQSETVDCVLLDYLMPDMDGRDVAMELKRSHPDVPIILYSSVTQLPREVRELANACLMKLDGPEKLLAALDRHCLSAA